MGGSLRIGRFFGIDVFLHWTFGLLIVGAAAFYTLQGAPLLVTLAGIALILAVFLCVVLHEFGHALAARRYDVPTKDITLYPIGGVARLQRIPEHPSQELVVAIAGPAVNVVIAGVLLAGLLATGQSLAFTGGLINPLDGFFSSLMWLNVVLVGFNLLPAFPMDGGRVLRAVLAMRMDYVRATTIAATVGQGMAFLFGLVGVIVFNPFLLFIAIFVYLGAQQEAGAAQMRQVIRGVTVGQAMITQYTPLAPENTLADAVALLLAGSEQEFIVTANARPEGPALGVLTRKQLIGALSERNHATPVGEIMQAACASVDPGNPLDHAFERMQENRCPLLPVERNGRLVGLLTLENVGELMMLSTAVTRRGGSKLAFTDWFRGGRKQDGQ